MYQNALFLDQADVLPNSQAKDIFSLQEQLGASEAISQVIADIKVVAPTDFAVLIIGETGSGKELVANAIHNLGHRKNGPFVPVDCGSIPPTLIESELFGYEKGSFTGADRSKPGKFEVATKGTLFLDEISNLPLDVQPKLLRALQEKQIWRIGGSQSKNVNIRIVSATNQDIRTLSEASHFRQDLYHRLNEFSVRVPPLRDRGEDILLLAKRFVQLTNQELNKKVGGMSEAALRMLVEYRWPGNVRELRNVIRRAVLLSERYIEPEHLGVLRTPLANDSYFQRAGIEIDGNVPFKEIVRCTVRHVEMEVLRQTLKRTGGNKAEAARILHIDYKTIHKKVRDYGISG